MSIFLPTLQEKLVPIYFITRKGVPFYWGDEQQKAFDSIKHDVTNAPVLLMPNATGHFVLVSDTSKIGCGAVLYQKQKGKYHLIAAQNSACKIRYIYQILPSEYYPNPYM